MKAGFAARGTRDRQEDDSGSRSPLIQFDARGIENFLGERGTLGSSRKNQCTEHGGEPEETDSFVVGKSCGKIPTPSV